MSAAMSGSPVLEAPLDAAVSCELEPLSGSAGFGKKKRGFLRLHEYHNCEWYSAAPHMGADTAVPEPESSARALTSYMKQAVRARRAEVGVKVFD
jgi:hypothetical protein